MADENPISESIELVKSYAKQEIADPLKHLSTFFKWGGIGAAFTLLGSLLVVLGTLRVMQSIDDDPANDSTSVKELSVGELNQIVASAVANEMAANEDPQVLSLSEVDVDELTIAEFNELVADAQAGGTAAADADGDSASWARRFFGNHFTEYLLAFLVALLLAGITGATVFRSKS